jgi:hypothetical protein
VILDDIELKIVDHEKSHCSKLYIDYGSKKSICNVGSLKFDVLCFQLVLIIYLIFLF